MNISSVNNIYFSRKITDYLMPKKGKKKIFDICPQEELLKELRKKQGDLLNKLAFCDNEEEYKKILQDLKDLGNQIKDIEG